MKSADFLDALRDHYGVNSDRKLAARLGWDRTRLSGYRTGRREFDEQTCAAVAQKLNLSAGYVLAEIQAERADCTEIKMEWQAIARMLKSISTTAGAALLGIGLVALEGAGKAAQGAVWLLCKLLDALGSARLWRLLARPEGKQRDCRHARRKPLLNRPGIWQCLDCARTGCYPVKIEWTRKKPIRRFVSRVSAFSAHGRQIGRVKCDLRHVRPLTLALLWPVLAGCVGTSADVMLAGKIGDDGFYGQGPTATLRIRQQITERTWCEYEHVSHLLAGRPFGPSADEDRLNQVGCGISFGNDTAPW